jgi:hypothetical protein
MMYDDQNDGGMREFQERDAQEQQERGEEGMKNSNIAKAFVAAQRGFAPALKSSTNPHFKSRYADLAACVEAVIDALHSQGIALTQVTHECEGGVMVETVFLHESGETMSGGKLFLPASKQDAQGYGSALTYARRYALMAACGIAPEDDDGNAATKSAPLAVPKYKGMPPEDFGSIIDYIEVAETEKALQNLYRQASQGGASEAQMERVTLVCAARKKTILARDV